MSEGCRPWGRLVLSEIYSSPSKCWSRGDVGDSDASPDAVHGAIGRNCKVEAEHVAKEGQHLVEDFWVRDVEDPRRIGHDAPHTQHLLDKAPPATFADETYGSSKYTSD